MARVVQRTEVLSVDLGKKLVCLVTGVGGQDGAYLAKWLIEQGHTVVGAIRRGGVPKTGRLQALGIEDKINLVQLDITEFANVISIVRQVKPDWIFNLAAQSFVKDSFDHPHLTSQIDYFGVLNFLEAVRLEGIDTRIYQASTSEMFGDVSTSIQNEDTPFNPASPYGVAKVAAHHLVKNYRSAYGMSCCSGILFNHESELRGREFVTRKITSHLAEVKVGKRDCVRLGNLDAARDWGYAPDYVVAMAKMLESGGRTDYVVATNSICTVRDFLHAAATELGFKPELSGENEDETCVDANTGKVIAMIDKNFYRPSDVNYLRGDFSRIAADLSWKPSVYWQELAAKMARFDLELLKTGGVTAI